MQSRHSLLESGIKDVGIWIRVSTDDQARGESPEHHEKRARLYAEAKGWNVLELYDLSGVSGKTVMSHPEAKRMITDISSGNITGLIFSKLARLARNTRELLDFSDIFSEHDADLISLQESIDTSSPAGRLFYTMIAAMAEWEREEIAERVRASVPIRAKLGKHVGGRASYGYQLKNGKLVPDPNEAPVRKLIYELFAEHQRKKAVARILNDQGYRTRNGSRFSGTTITRLLSDPTAKGLHRANYTKKEGNGSSLKPESEWVYQEVEPVVSKELWDECNSILRKQSKGRPPVRKAEYLFSSYVHCHCGGKMYVLLPSPKYTCRKCRNKIPMDDLEALFHEQLKSFFFSEKDISRHLKRANETLMRKEELIRVLESERDKISAEMDSVYELYIAREITKTGFGGRYRPLEERLEQIAEQFPELQAEIDILKISYLSSEEVISGSRDLYSRWSELPFKEKRSIVEAITDSVVVSDNEIEINLHYIPTIQENSGKKGTNQQGFIAAINWMRDG